MADDPNASEYELRPVEGTTTNPFLPVLQAGKPHLDVPADITPRQLRDIIRLFDREVLALFDPKTGLLTHAPIVGEGSSVDYSAFADELTGRLLIHNHPSGKLISPTDVGACYEQGLAEIQATSPSGGYCSLTPKKGVWKDRQNVGKAVNGTAREWFGWIREETSKGRPLTLKDERLKYNELMRNALQGLPVKLRVVKKENDDGT